MMRYMTVRPWFLAVGLIALLFLAVSSPALAADTRLGNYEEAPYRDVVDIDTVDLGEGFSPRTYVKIPFDSSLTPSIKETLTAEWFQGTGG